MDWKEKAARLFFLEGKSISETAEETGISRQSVSAYLKSCPGFAEEKERRKLVNQMKRRAYKREKNREYREAYSMRVTPETMRREHEIAVMLLSHER